MGKEDFESQLALYGSDVTKWPDQLKDAMRNQVGENAELQNVWEREILLDALLKDALAVPTPAGLADRVYIAALKRSTSKLPVRQSVPDCRRDFALSRPAFALILTALFGFLAAYLTVGSQVSVTTNSLLQPLFAVERSFL